MTGRRALPFDRLAVVAVVAAIIVAAGRAWLDAHPEHDPWAPLSIDDPPGWATARKLGALRGDAAECAAFLKRSAIAFERLPATGDGACRREDRIVLLAAQQPRLAPAGPDATCAVIAGLAIWNRQVVQPAANAELGQEVRSLEHFGTHSCRRIGGGDTGSWSEHATGNAIDLAAFRLSDGSRISVLQDWPGDSEAARFLRRVRDGACGIFATTLSPDYNLAHADHLHLDQAGRASGWSACR